MADDGEARADATDGTTVLGGRRTTPAPPDPNAPASAAANGGDITPATGREAAATAATTHPPEADDHRSLHEYAARYSGRTLVARLLFIARRCGVEATEREALRMALEEVKKGKDLQIYGDIHNMIAGRFGEPYDQGWVDSIQSTYSNTLGSIEKELEACKASGFPELIRTAYLELGDFHYSRGYVSDALKTYIQTEDYLTLPHHLTQLCLHAILINLELGNFDRVLESVRIAQGSPNPLDAITVAKLHAAAGLALMRKNEYRLAALQFLEVGPELANNYSEVIAPQDVAIYGSFCALTAFTSSEIKEVVENTMFQYFLALVPDAWQMITSFCHGQHTTCMEYLDSLSSTLVLDCHLSMHVKTLHLVISQKSGFVNLDDISVDDLFQTTNTPQNDNSPEPNIRSNMMLPDNFDDDLELESSEHYTFVKCKDLLHSLDKRRSKWVSRCHSCAVLLNADFFVIDSVDSEGRDKRVDGRIVLVTDEKFSLLDVEFDSYTTTGRTLKERRLKDDEDSPVDRFEMKGDKWARRRTCLRANAGFHLLQWRRTSGLRRLQVQPLEAPPAENSTDPELKELFKTLIEQLKENCKTVVESSQDIRKSRDDIVEACSAAVTAMSGGVVN